MSSLPLRFEGFIRFCLWRLQVILGLIPALKAQTLYVTYEVSLSNTSDTTKTVDLVLPCPRETSYQKIGRPVEHTPTPSYVLTEEAFGNSYAHWKLSLAPGEMKIIKQISWINIGPRFKPSQADTSEDEQRRASKSRPHIDASDPEIQKIAQQIQHATGTDVRALIEAINRYVVTNLTYGNPIPDLYSARDALTHTVVDCGGFSTLFIALCLACHITARLVCGFWTDAKHQSMHAWAEAFIPGEGWIVVDPNVEQMRESGRTSRLGLLGKVGSDRVVYSLGCDLSLNINGKVQTIDILQTPYLFPADSEIEMTYSFKTKPLEHSV